MSLSLEKKVELVGLSLKKFGVEDIVARVVMVNDGSGSMADLYKNGAMQELNDRAMAVAVKADDDGNLEQYVFATNFKKLPDADATMFGSYIEKHLLPGWTWGGTHACGVMQAVVDSYVAPVQAPVVQAEKTKGFFSGLFGKKESSKITPPVVTPSGTDPMFVLFQTDGDFMDATSVEALLERHKNVRIFWNFVGVGTDTTFNFLKKVAQRFENVSFFHAPDISEMTDQELYSGVLNEKFCSWYKTNA